MNYDIFNGDADGIISLLQLRMSNPVQSTLITGVKRDIKLLDKVKFCCGDELTVLDISMEKNIDALNLALDAGASVLYIDHHRSGICPKKSNLDAHIDLDANTCTALIVDQMLERKYHFWAIAAAYGDNLIDVADRLSKDSGLSVELSASLNELGTLINYNGYGSEVTDLHYHPADLYRALSKYETPFEVIADLSSPFYVLQEAYSKDIALARSISSMYQSDKLLIVELPDEAWARRISGVYGNALANEKPNVAHVILTKNSDGQSFTVSVRAPLANKHGAGDICSQFETGGGRAAAAGINALPIEQVQKLIQLIEATY
ncbi:DHHA1 domain-containing protein [Shewanella halifaxensis]|uniref:DHHA1 domain-containing protein n=1 Tax=Shewanella halifaxensis TaxID=271098 RepID=UPI000D58E372|nr:acetyltransferase [Shewanella halifaxensis]